MRQVTRDEFFKAINPLNVHPRIVSDVYPYTSDWIMQDGSRALIGRTIPRLHAGVVTNDYYLK